MMMMMMTITILTMSMTITVPMMATMMMTITVDDAVVMQVMAVIKTKMRRSMEIFFFDTSRAAQSMCNIGKAANPLVR